MAANSKTSDVNNDGSITAGELSKEINKLLASSNVPQFSGNNDFKIATISDNYLEQKKNSAYRETQLCK